MTRIFLPLSALSAVLSLSACAQLGWVQPEDSVPPAIAEEAAEEVVTPPSDLPEATAADVAAVKADPVLTSAPPPPKAAKTQEALDTTTTEQRKQAAAPAAPEVTSKLLGTTIASLGSPTEPGFWLKTPLVKSETAGRVTNKANGKSSAVTLIPIDGPASGGSRLSLPAMRLIEASLTDLTELEVTLGG
ncbi:hypothetical protein [Sulfitobacter donghicola]|uniref:D-galactarate dehydratase n=1 Tax=Sulfitobacter donghicola DSW-25 = KCTC 12864 = JCM 14565 TaxID=1300350 RepID=A0A073IIQ6_9RHOB|nr:hypothetical protein [Sulfitobacter donghicola]KEJ89401.1 hypothetical protein DSW25_10345 [Sulfitobacter donghicola DSW-25 = KCTC 12864 = JCM 14565]KIN69217.1 hypothetical protein Z948_2956 [Sulfitobacter donghicola DSW-25 = KCTC 12864 = JCM 14565]